MVNEDIKSQEIKRLTTPLSFKNSKAYDNQGKLVNCIESLTEIKYVIEPRPGILTDDEILQYAPDSKAASKIRLKRGFGNFSDIFLVHESLPWFLAIYYMFIICFSIPINHGGNKLWMFTLLILSVIPLLYLYYIFNLKKYSHKKPKKEVKKESVKNVDKTTTNEEETCIESLREYQIKINDLTVLYEVKENAVRDLIEKRFEPPQITYNRFMSAIDACNKLFYNQADAGLKITKLASEKTPRIENELENKINSMKLIINQIEELTNELVINISSDEKYDDVKILIEDMENLIESVKEY